MRTVPETPLDPRSQQLGSCFLLLFFLPVAHLLFKAVKKEDKKEVLEANEQDITLFVERRLPLVVFQSFLKSGH